MVHRDLKLENLLLVDEHLDSAVKIADFGLSKFFGKDESVLATMCGSPEYVAPEVLGVDEFSDHYTPAVDMWSVGVVLFAMMCCYTPFCKPLGYPEPATCRFCDVNPNLVGVVDSCLWWCQLK